MRFLSQTRAFFMRRGNSRSRPPRDGLAVASVLLIMLLVCAGEFSTTAQEPVRTPQGTIATFAPVVEKVVPTVPCGVRTGSCAVVENSPAQTKSMISSTLATASPSRGGRDREFPLRIKNALV